MKKASAKRPNRSTPDEALSDHGRGWLYWLGRRPASYGATDNQVLVLDKLTYASSLESLAPVKDDPHFVKLVTADITEVDAVRHCFDTFKPDVAMHLAAESHVDRSIDGPAAFIQTNIVGTYILLQEALHYWRKHPAKAFRFHHVSTDEVLGSLGADGLFNEESP